MSVVNLNDGAISIAKNVSSNILSTTIEGVTISDANTAELILTEKGLVIIRKGHMYIIEEKVETIIKWKCVKRASNGCRALLVTASDFANPFLTSGHTHGPDYDATQAIRTKFPMPGILNQESDDSLTTGQLPEIRIPVMHLMQTPPQSTSAAKTIRIAAQPLSKPQLKPAPPPTGNSSSKTLVLKTIPLKMKPVAPGTIKMASRQQSQSHFQSQPPPPPPAKPPSNSMPQQSPEVCLRWNSYHSNMQNSFPSLLDSEEFVDVTLACEGRSLKCHKMILSSCSDYLATLLRENPCQHPIILMKDLKFWEVEALVKFMYRGEVNVAHDKLPQLLNAAEALQVKGLAGPTPSAQGSKPPMLIPQSKPASKPQAIPNFRITKEPKNSSTAQPTVSPKRVPKRPPPDSDDAPRTFTKIRLQRPTTPPSPSATIKLEPLDIPLSPNDIFPGNDDSANNYENLMMHEDDPGGPDTPDEPNFPTITTVQDLNDADDNMEFIPSDFLEQEQDIADDECSRSSVDEASTRGGGGGRLDEFEDEKSERNPDNSSKKDKT